MRQVIDEEISFFVKYHALSQSDDGETIAIKAGDGVRFDENSKGGRVYLKPQVKFI